MRLYKRGRTWWAVYYQDGERVRQSTRCHDRKAAEVIAKQWEQDAANPADAAARVASVSDALKLLLDNREELATAGRRSPDTVSFYRKKAGHLVRLFELDEQGQYVPFPLARLRAWEVDQYISKRRAEKAGENTIYKELVTLRSALKLAKRKGIWAGDVDAVCPVAFAPEYEPRTRFLSPEELRRLIAQLTADRAARVAFIVATSANLRESELATRADVTEGLGRVHLRGTKTRYRKRTVPIVSPAAQALLRYALEHAQGQAALFTPWSNVRRLLMNQASPRQR
jgi:site-specific recombinase XerD